MKRGLYFRLAATGMSKNKKFYFYIDRLKYVEYNKIDPNKYIRK